MLSSGQSLSDPTKCKFDVSLGFLYLVSVLFLHAENFSGFLHVIFILAGMSLWNSK